MGHRKGVGALNLGHGIPGRFNGASADVESIAS